MKIKLLIPSQIKINYWNKKYQFTTKERERQRDGEEVYHDLTILELRFFFLILVNISHIHCNTARVELKNINNQ